MHFWLQMIAPVSSMRSLSCCALPRLMHATGKRAGMQADRLAWLQTQAVFSRSPGRSRVSQFLSANTIDVLQLEALPGH
jgi:hypothetical protein